MSHPITRRWTRSGVDITSEHPQFGSIHRGRVVPVRTRVEGAGAYGAWKLVNADFCESELLIVGDYLSAEGILLDQTVWAEEPAGPNDFEE